MNQNLNHADGKKLLHSFKFALKGIIYLLKTEQNARIHLAATILVFLLSITFNINHLEAAIIFIAVIMVFAMEIINTAVEKIIDFLHPDNHNVIATVKDALAGAVLIAGTIALVVAFLIFYPYFRDLYLMLTA